eukprot:scaffold109545_cov47-Prasinocladus_malaysianus.AAC.2
MHIQYDIMICLVNKCRAISDRPVSVIVVLWLNRAHRRLNACSLRGDLQDTRAAREANAPMDAGAGDRRAARPAQPLRGRPQACDGGRPAESSAGPRSHPALPAALRLGCPQPGKARPAEYPIMSA